MLDGWFFLCYNAFSMNNHEDEKELDENYTEWDVTDRAKFRRMLVKKGSEDSVLIYMPNYSEAQIMWQTLELDLWAGAPPPIPEKMSEDQYREFIALLYLEIEQYGNLAWDYMGDHRKYKQVDLYAYALKLCLNVRLFPENASKFLPENIIKHLNGTSCWVEPYDAWCEQSDLIKDAELSDIADDIQMIYEKSLLIVMTQKIPEDQTPEI